MEPKHQIKFAEVFIGAGEKRSYHLGEESLAANGSMIKTTDIRYSAAGALVVEFSDGQRHIYINAPCLMGYEEVKKEV
jgi:hypothetical protein